MRSSAVTNGRPLTYILKFKPGQQQPCSKDSLAGGLLQDGGTEKLQTAHECRNRGKCGWKENKNVRLYAGTGSRGLFFLTLGRERSSERKSQQQESNTTLSQCLLNQ